MRELFCCCCSGGTSDISDVSVCTGPSFSCRASSFLSSALGAAATLDVLSVCAIAVGVEDGPFEGSAKDGNFGGACRSRTAELVEPHLLTKKPLHPTDPATTSPSVLTSYTEKKIPVAVERATCRVHVLHQTLSPCPLLHPTKKSRMRSTVLLIKTCFQK
ncbi:hypothetical protein MRX96_049262 [Rhipicephalus microplus]